MDDPVEIIERVDEVLPPSNGEEIPSGCDMINAWRMMNGERPLTEEEFNEQEELRRKAKRGEEDVGKEVPQSVGFILEFPPDLFRDFGTFYELKFAQKSPEWLVARKKRVTASIFAQAAGHSPYKTRERLLREMAGLDRPLSFAYHQRMAMERGVILEPFVRDRYEDIYKVEVRERGLIVPKWNTRIGVSVDGYILPKNDGKKRLKGIIEIKCPMNMYPELVDNSHRRAKGEKFPPFYRAHIKPDHYDQMQGGLAILDCDYCDYIVYVEKTNDIYVTRILRDREYWDKELYPNLCSFLVELDRIS